MTPRTGSRCVPHGVTAAFCLLVLTTFAQTVRAQEPPPAADAAARIVARALAEAVIARSVDAATALCALPVNLEGEQITTARALRERWEQVLHRDDLRGLRLAEIELLTLQAAIEHYGPPPQRLGELEPTALVAIIRWDRAQLTAILARRDDRWSVIAVTD